MCSINRISAVNLILNLILFLMPALGLALWSYLIFSDFMDLYDGA